MTRGIVDTIKLATTVALAVPVGYAGASLFFGGDRLVGVGLLVVAVGMVAIEEYLYTPEDVPASAAKKVVGAVAKTPDEDEE